jgi:hypothetical protein
MSNTLLSNIVAPSSVVTSSATQTLTNKTLNSAVLTGTLTAGGSTGTAGQVLQSTGTGLQWANVTTSGGSTGTVTSITAGTGLTGGTITSSGTVAIDTTVVTTLTGTQTLTNKTISGASNTLTNIPNSALTNSSITINSAAVSLGGSASINTLVNGSFTASFTSTGQLQLPVITQGSTTGGVLVAAGNVLLNANGNIWNFGSDGTMTSPYSVKILTTGIQFPDSTQQTTAYTGPQTSVTGNAGTATKLATAITINGVSFDGSANVTVTTAGTGISVSGTAVSIDSTVATLTGSQTLTNKTLTSPTINSATENNLTLIGTVTAGGTIGTIGQVLQSTGTGVQWATVSGGGSSGFPYVDAGSITDQINTSAQVDGGTIV